MSEHLEGEFGRRGEDLEQTERRRTSPERKGAKKDIPLVWVWAMGDGEG